MQEDKSTIGHGLGTLLSDYLLFAPSGARRAGAATLMAKRVGIDPGRIVRNPMKAQAVAALAGLPAAVIAGGIGGSRKAAIVAAALPLLGTQWFKRNRIKFIDKKFTDTKKKKRLEEIKANEMVLDAIGSHRLGMARAYEAMRTRKIRDIGAIAEAADALPIAMSIAGFIPGSSLPVTQLIDQLESSKFIKKASERFSQDSSLATPAYILAAIGSTLAAQQLGKKVFEDSYKSKESIPFSRDSWPTLIKHVAGRDIHAGEVSNLNNAYFFTPKNTREATGVQELLLTDQANEAYKVYDTPYSPSPNLRMYMDILRDGAIAVDTDMATPYIISHEAGHGKVNSTPGLARFLQRNIYNHGPKLAPIASVGSLAAGLSLGSPLKGLLAGTGIGLLGSAGTIIPEFMASKYALDGLKSFEGGRYSRPNDFKNLAIALGTYATSLTLPSMLTGTLGGYISKRRKENKAKHALRIALSSKR